MARIALSKEEARKHANVDAREQAAKDKLFEISQKTYSQMTSDDKDFLLKRLLEVNGFIKPE